MGRPPAKSVVASPGAAMSCAPWPATPNPSYRSGRRAVSPVLNQSGITLGFDIEDAVPITALTSHAPEPTPASARTIGPAAISAPKTSVISARYS
jgi:hypothetical protein